MTSSEATRAAGFHRDRSIDRENSPSTVVGPASPMNARCRSKAWPSDARSPLQPIASEGSPRRQDVPVSRFPPKFLPFPPTVRHPDVPSGQFQETARAPSKGPNGQPFGWRQSPHRQSGLEPYQCPRNAKLPGSSIAASGAGDLVGRTDSPETMEALPISAGPTSGGRICKAVKNPQIPCFAPSWRRIFRSATLPEAQTSDS